MVHNLKTRFLAAAGAVFAVLTIVSSVVTIGQAYAEAGNEGGIEGGACGDWWDTCFGATWQYYETTEDTVTIPGNSNVSGGTVRGCGQYGGYYRLALATHRGGVRQAVTSGGKSITQYGLIQVYKIYHNNWTRAGAESPHPNLVAFRENDQWGVGWNKAKSLFDVARENNATNGFEWREVSWFCYDKKWDSPTTEFQSKSKVMSGGASSESLAWDQNAQDLEVQADENNQATVSFTHRLRYNTNDLTGNYNPASTVYTITIDDGSGGPWGGTWQTPGARAAESPTLPENATISTTVTLGENEESKRVCSKISYTTKTLSWSDTDPHTMVPKNDIGQTEACAVIKKTERVIEGVGQVEFWSQSAVESVDEPGKDIANHKEWTKEKTTGDKVTLQLSTDFNNAKVNFEHGISYEVVFAEGKAPGPNDTVELGNMKTNWTVNLAAGGTSTGTYTIPSITSSGSLSIVSTTSNHTVNIPSPGYAEEKITYQKKVVPIKREEKKDGPCKVNGQIVSYTCSWDPKRYRYYAEENAGSGRGDSAARIEYVNPNEPNDNNGKPSSSGGANGGPMYAGESVGMVWRGYAEPKEARRIIEDRSVAFEVMYNKAYSAAAVAGDINSNLKYPNRSKFDPCQYWNQAIKLGTFRFGSSGCATVSAATRTFSDWSSPHTSTYSQTMVVPDYVGDKYCNSFAFRWRYYYGVKRNSDGGNFVWRPEADENRFTYWTHYDAACRTIAKKPSEATWNGGVFAKGSIMTALASRYNNPVIGATASGYPNASFGSWSEHLGVANGTIGNPLNVRGSGFGTGSSLAFGSGIIGVGVGLNSPLTISNDTTLGMAAITPNPTLVSRLGDYLGNLTGTTLTLTDSVVEIYNGSFGTASNSVGGTYGDVYQLPQNIIYAPNATEVKIHSDVTTINAWIIAPNATINTCAEFQESSHTGSAHDGTETRPDATHICDNPLRVNGPVIANTLKLNRTGGADITNDGSMYTTTFGSTYTDDWQKYTPAEVFNLSADVYLWAYAQAGRYGSSYTEAYSRELPPRY